MNNRTTREEELQIEVERLKSWLHFIQVEAYKEVAIHRIEQAAEDAIKHSSCAVHPDWEPTEDWATIGTWPKHWIEKTKECRNDS